MDYYKIGQRIRKYRKAAELTQEQLADMVGISVTHMNHIETGNTKMSLPVAADIAKSLSVHVDALLYERMVISRTETEDEVLEVLQSCSSQELSVVLDMVRALKTSKNVRRTKLTLSVTAEDKKRLKIIAAKRENPSQRCCMSGLRKMQRRLRNNGKDREICSER